MKRPGLCFAAAAALLGLMGLGAPGSARAQDFYLGQLQQFGYNWCPENWQRADGSLLSIAANSPLYALIGTTFGGDGVNTFAVPDLRDRAPIGQAVNLPIGTTAGWSSMTMSEMNVPSHSHAFNADPTPPVGNSPANSMMGIFAAGQTIYASPAAGPDTPMNGHMLQPTGGSQPVPIQMPVLATNWCIALYGVFPQRP